MVDFKTQAGYTLIELLIVIALLALIGIIGVIGLGGLQRQAQFNDAVSKAQNTFVEVRNEANASVNSDCQATGTGSSGSCLAGAPLAPCTTVAVSGVVVIGQMIQLSSTPSSSLTISTLLAPDDTSTFATATLKQVACRYVTLPWQAQFDPTIAGPPASNSSTFVFMRTSAGGMLKTYFLPIDWTPGNVDPTKDLLKLSNYVDSNVAFLPSAVVWLKSADGQSTSCLVLDRDSGGVANTC